MRYVVYGIDPRRAPVGEPMARATLEVVRRLGRAGTSGVSFVDLRSPGVIDDLGVRLGRAVGRGDIPLVVRDKGDADDISDLGDTGTVTGPSNVVNEERAAKDPKVAAALIQARWNELIPWFAKSGGPAQLPELVPFLQSWQEFKTLWDEKHDWDTLLNFNWKDVLGDKKAEEALGGAAHDVAMAESNAIRRGYVVPRMFIDGDGHVTRDASELGMPTGVSSPSASPLGTPRKGPDVTVTAPATPTIATLHPTATRVDENARALEKAVKDKLPNGDSLGLGIVLGVIAAAFVLRGRS